MKFAPFALALAVAMPLAGCEQDNRYRGSARHNVPISSELYSLMAQQSVTKDSPVLIRSFKKESELEVWKQRRDGEYVLLKTYPICRWSGQLGPKKREGDRMTPEGFYHISPAQMNPNSSYYLSFNMGYPNTYDRAHGRTGAHLMVHGACSSMGCYSMTDDQIQDIYALVREAQAGGQKAVQMQSYPFRMTAENLAKHRYDPNMGFWKNLKEGADLFEVTKREPAVGVCGTRYNFGTQKDELGCAPRVDAQVASAVSSKRRDDDAKVAALVASGTPAIKLVYDDGDQHKSFKQVLAAQGTGGLNNASWASRAYGVSRVEALSSGPTVVVLDSSGKAKGQARAHSAEADHVLAAAAAVPATEAAPAAASAPVNATPRPASAAAARTATASAKPLSSRQAAAATTEVARSEAPAEAPSVMQRMMALNPFGRAQQ